MKTTTIGADFGLDAHGAANGRRLCRGAGAGRMGASSSGREERGQGLDDRPDGADRRDALTIAFEKKYGIAVEYHADSGAGILPRLSAERKADRYLWDVVITGTTTGLENLIPARVLDPLEANLILPEVKDLKLWRNGALEFLDPGRQLLVMTPFQRGTLFVNPTLANPKEFKSYKDLLDPKWKGKIVADDPRKSGPGQATFTFFFLHPELGVKFIRAIAGQGLTLLRDYAQEVNMLGQGRYPVGTRVLR